MKAIIHIGTAKTGSTTIQGFLSDNLRRLNRAGYYIPMYRPTKQYGFHAYALTQAKHMSEKRLSNYLGIHSQADLEAFQSKFKKKAQGDLARASKKSSHLVLSAEGLSSRNKKEIRRLRELLEPSCSEFLVVIYLRRQDLKRASQFRNMIKNRGYTSGEVFTEKYVSSLDYYSVCKRWARVFGESAVHPRIFPDSALETYDLIDDFAEVSGIAETSVYPKLKRAGRRNEAWDWRAVEFYRLMNDHLPALVDGKMPSERKRLEEVLKNCFPECEQRRLPRAEAMRFYEIYRESNDKLRDEWFPHQASVFQEDFSKYPENPAPRELSVEEAIFITTRILQAS